MENFKVLYQARISYRMQQLLQQNKVSGRLLLKMESLDQRPNCDEQGLLQATAALATKKMCHDTC